jgi:hypothetical protein
VPDTAVVARQVSSADVAGQQVYSVWTVSVQDTKSGKVYTCVMHPEVKEKKPGACPKCNMPLTAEQTGGQRLAHLVDVTVGPSDGQRTQILSGIAAGQEIITRGTENLREGQAVQSVPYGPEGPLQLAAPAASSTAAPAKTSGGSQSMPGMDMSGQGR